MNDRNVIAALHGFLNMCSDKLKASSREHVDLLLNEPFVQACQPDILLLACSKTMKTQSTTRLVYTYGYLHEGYYTPIGCITRPEYIDNTGEHIFYQDHNYCFAMEKPRLHEVIQGFNSVKQCYVPQGTYLLVMDEEDYKLDLLSATLSC